MKYSEFEYILCNRLFTMAVFFPNEYSGVRHLIIQDARIGVVMITINREENIIRVAFDNVQKKYSSYEEALEGIKKHFGLK